MQAHFAGLAKTNQRGGGAGVAVTIQAMDFHAFTKRLPDNLVLPFGDAVEVGELGAWIRKQRGGFGGQGHATSHTELSAIWIGRNTENQLGEREFGERGSGNTE